MYDAMLQLYELSKCPSYVFMFKPPREKNKNIVEHVLSEVSDQPGHKHRRLRSAWAYA